MEELKELIHLINGLPALAVWVLVGFWAYKVIVIGSIYGLIKFLATKALEAYKKERVVRTVMESKIGGMTIQGEDGAVMAAIMSQILRLASAGGYLHADAADKLRRALDLLAEQEKANDKR